jgi:hypothetical protein
VPRPPTLPDDRFGPSAEQKGPKTPPDTSVVNYNCLNLCSLWARRLRPEAFEADIQRQHVTLGGTCQCHFWALLPQEGKREAALEIGIPDICLTAQWVLPSSMLAT